MKTLFLFFSLLVLGTVVRAQEAIFIANPSVAESSLSADDLKNVLLGNKIKWSSGNLKLIVHSEGAVHQKVIQTYTQRSADQFDKYWKKQVFSGKGIAPATAKTDAEVVEYVSKNPGAFGYVAADSSHPGVKEIAIK